MGTKLESPRSPLVEDQHTTGGRPVRKSRIQLQREVFSPRILSIVMIFVGAMVLNAEL
jgi:hypothetical protein